MQSQINQIPILVYQGVKLIMNFSPDEKVTKAPYHYKTLHNKVERPLQRVQCNLCIV